MCTVERLSKIKELLQSSKRTPSGNLAGLILRRSVMFCITHAPTYSSAQEALDPRGASGRSHGDELRHAVDFMKDWRKDKYDDSATITRGSALLEDAFLNLTPYMDAGCMTARPLTPAKRLAAVFRRVGLSHLCITDKNNIFQGLITRRSLITPPPHLMPPTHAGHAHGHGGAPAAAGHDDDLDAHELAAPIPAAVAAQQQQQQPEMRRRRADEGEEGKML